jgi:5-methyltetrahydrofolate--homocysteine methyltransferase
LCGQSHVRVRPLLIKFLKSGIVMTFCLRTFAAKVRVTDGVYGTELQKKGLATGGCPELMNAEHPEVVQEIGRSYVEAGSDVIMTNSLGAHRFMLAHYGAAGRAGELAEAAATVSKRAVEGTDVKVFGSFGPTGKIVMMGEVREDELAAAFAETAEALARGGADAIVLETFNELAEAEIAVKAVKEVCKLPVVVSMAFAYGPDKSATMMGETPEQLAKMVEAVGADAVGANCGVGPQSYVKVARMLAEATELPVWIKPNAGLPVLKDGQTVFPMGPEEFASFVPELVRAGAKFIGGCCGTTPEHIRAIRKAVAS